ncbi:MAG: hypothetical protein AAGB27_04595 [Pseudomonadota bacterium]
MRAPTSLLLTALLCACATTPTAQGPSEQELAAFLLYPMFDVLDCTQQGFIEAAEVDEHLAFLFTPLDRDRSMALTPNEYVLAKTPEDRVRQELIFARADSNGDRRLTVAEYRLRLIDLIDAADDNGDGEVTRSELASGSAAGRGG